MEGVIIGDSWAISQTLLHFAYDSGNLISFSQPQSSQQRQSNLRSPAGTAEGGACACSKVNSTLPALPFSLELVRSPRVLRTPDGMAVFFWLVFLGQGRLEQGIYNFEGTSLVATCCPSEVSREQ